MSTKEARHWGNPYEFRTAAHLGLVIVKAMAGHDRDTVLRTVAVLFRYFDEVKGWKAQESINLVKYYMDQITNMPKPEEFES